MRTLSFKHRPFSYRKGRITQSVDTKAMENYSQGAVRSSNQRASGMCPSEFQSFNEPVPAVYMLFLFFEKKHLLWSSYS